ncbi:Uma2 family endonuclease [Polyangium jinanense]|uniref:Uma2 family endonuclease n=2 Tax=Polyangium jinanense TaxID=2829994 RepID=A0A9X3X664_9BACT|nr:Uma2 family endonuclease [Polyangium jinanense]MDC3983053.1 Uma2 family endonuclease [Polyangium jinanense]
MAPQVTESGPFKAEQVRAGDPYELSRGHIIERLPAGGRGGRAKLVGAAVLNSDPAVRSASVDTGFSPDPGTMRALDIAVGDIPDAPGWLKSAPLLAVEYVDTGHDEDELQMKVAELLEAGTKIIWVVRLFSPRRVEVYEPGARARTLLPGEMLSASNILANPIPVEALYDRNVAHRVTLKNLLQRKAREEGELHTLRASVREVFSARGLRLSPDHEAQIDQCSDPAVLRRWHRAAVTAPDASAALS